MKSWKSRSFPLVTLTKAEAILLFRYHLRILEVVPIVAGYYRVYIGEGNNGQLIGKLLKNRGFWIITSDTN